MIHKYTKTDVEGLVKDNFSGAILNVNNEELENYKKRKQNSIKADRANERLNKVENELLEIKQMLQQLLKR